MNKKEIVQEIEDEVSIQLKCIKEALHYQDTMETHVPDFACDIDSGNNSLLLLIKNSEHRISPSLSIRPMISEHIPPIPLWHSLDNP